MKLYKINKQGTIDNTETGSYGIHPGVWMYADYEEWVSLGNTPDPYVEPIPAYEDIIDSMTSVLQEHMDSVARSRGYDSILSLCTYATSSVEKFAMEGTAGVVFRDAVWSYGQQIVGDVLAGLRGIPSAEELIAELPKITWI